MPNLNKYTKAELISKFKKLENKTSKQSYLKRSIEYIILFKGLILKVTLITFLIKWIKNSSLVEKLWYIFSLIGNTLLGFSLIDIYSLDFINWIKDTSVYKWYIELFSESELFHKESKPSKFSEHLIERTSIETNGIENGDQKNNNENNKDNWRINKEEIDKSNYRNYFIIGTIIIVSGVIWYYWNDLKPGDGANTVIEKIKSWFNNDLNNISDGNNQKNISTTIDQSITDNNPPESSQNQFKDILTKEVKERINQNEEIELIDSTITSKIKQVLNSPSLENLNNQVETSWNDSKPNSPDSVSSIETVKPVASTSTPYNDFTLISDKLAETLFWQENWRKIIDENILKEIIFIENNIENQDISKDIIDSFVNIIISHDEKVQFFELKDRFNISKEEIKTTREIIFQLRKWIFEYNVKINPNSNNIILGINTDSPKSIAIDLGL
jgi:5'-deoxynucleotidase YfbR-like HD superfamily hydrolase